MKTYAKFVNDLDTELQELMRRLENLQFHHSEIADEVWVYEFVSELLKEAAERMEVWNDHKAGKPA